MKKRLLTDSWLRDFMGDLRDGDLVAWAIIAIAATGFLVSTLFLAGII